MQYLAESAPKAMPFTPKPPQGPRTLRFTIPAPHAGNSRDTSSWQGPRPPRSWSLKVSWPWKERSEPQTVLWVRWDCSLTDQPTEMLRFGGSRGGAVASMAQSGNEKYKSPSGPWGFKLSLWTGFPELRSLLSHSTISARSEHSSHYLLCVGVFCLFVCLSKLPHFIHI